jgi:STE24 endopeptidase
MVVEIGLDIINLRFIGRQKDIPIPFINIYTQDDFKKSIKYTKEKTYFKIVALLIKTVVLFTMIITGFFGALDNWLYIYIPDEFSRGIIYPFAVMLVFYVIGLPQSYYYQFRLEDRFGFNRMSLSTFFTDQLKAIMLGLIIGIPLLASLLWIINKSGSYWWVFAFLLVMGFQLLTAAVYPVLLAPIFNKFTPLADGSLKSRIEQLTKDLHFRIAGIFTMDGSKRSSHSNAFFSGLGRMRRIVLFDTLTQSHNDDEIVAVIAHEIGHNAKKHIQKGLILSSIVTLAMFYVLSKAIVWPEFYEALGAYKPAIHVGLVLFILFSSVFMFPINPLFTLLSRIHEYEADEFSVSTTGNKDHLKTALIKLTKENLGNLNPHPWYSAYHYSHPTTIERIKAIDAYGGVK